MSMRYDKLVEIRLMEHKTAAWSWVQKAHKPIKKLT